MNVSEAHPIQGHHDKRKNPCVDITVRIQIPAHNTASKCLMLNNEVLKRPNVGPYKEEDMD